MALAIFDLDNTLLGTDSDNAWGEFAVARGIVDAETYGTLNTRFFNDYLDGKLDVNAYLEFCLEPLSRYSREELERWHALFMEEKIEPFILPRAIELVRRHEQAGDTTLIITATNRFVAGPIGRRYGIDIMLASECEEIDGRYTGKPCDIPCFREGKITRLQRWLEETGHDLKGAYFYSDSRNDLPLLSLVDNPVAVDPDDVLLAHAREHGWPVISLRD
ncbi:MULTISPECIES: histidinol-phosphatase [Halopseudomonas]|mgnify:FL=1|uniref:Histidinol-phosphatase n=1 Tax=Halopseudomonas formosensis TaxID=1002526 RepID=A0A1I6BT69_9GAMM|nr:HAD family hydrolase [Halopseudomonas formosensis]MDX9686197.1 HAD family hydrolase [Halopseudomonas formosensis]MDY3197256.1 HAD family hydrolase [Pseudomonadaceae bacterium]NLB99903.1 HAD family hydrolase [Halopseudomonas formosensis]SFQ84148.1 HAD-superfamily subfamily IB hydrolase, TIGR01490 [Halopseudomonas formosensis]